MALHDEGLVGTANTRRKVSYRGDRMENIETKRFGPFAVAEEQVVRFDEGILGFPDSHRYVLIPHEPESPFAWLQSLDEPNLAFLVINPAVVKQDYAVQLPSVVAEMLKLRDVSEGIVLAIVVVPQDPRKMRMNLRAPVVINTRERLGRQIILEDTSLEVQHLIVPEEAQAQG